MLKVYKVNKYSLQKDFFIRNENLENYLHFEGEEFDYLFDLRKNKVIELEFSCRRILDISDIKDYILLDSYDEEIHFLDKKSNLIIKNFELDGWRLNFLKPQKNFNQLLFNSEEKFRLINIESNDIVFEFEFSMTDPLYSQHLEKIYTDTGVLIFPQNLTNKQLAFSYFDFISSKWSLNKFNAEGYFEFLGTFSNDTLVYYSNITHELLYLSKDADELAKFCFESFYKSSMLSFLINDDRLLTLVNENNTSLLRVFSDTGELLQTDIIDIHAKYLNSNDLQTYEMNIYDNQLIFKGYAIDLDSKNICKLDFQDKLNWENIIFYVSKRGLFLLCYFNDRTGEYDHFSVGSFNSDVGQSFSEITKIPLIGE